MLLDCTATGKVSWTSNHFPCRKLKIIENRTFFLFLNISVTRRDTDTILTYYCRKVYAPYTLSIAWNDHSWFVHAIDRSDRQVKMYQMKNDKLSLSPFLACISKHKSDKTIACRSTTLQHYNDIACMKLAAPVRMLDTDWQRAHYFCRPLYRLQQLSSPGWCMQ